MKNILLLMFLLHTASFMFSQSADAIADCEAVDLHYEINRVHEPLAISKADLQSANTLTDLYPHFKPTWVRTYFSVVVQVRQNGQMKQAIGKDSVLTAAQKELIEQTDEGEAIAVVVNYIPENMLEDNEPKIFDFKFRVEAETSAAYIGGKQALRQYIQENAISKIPESTFEGYDLSIIHFTINTTGEVEDAHVFGREYRDVSNEKVDALLLKTIENMPCWKPATYASGLKVKQDFALTVGNHQSCVINVLNMRRKSE